MAKQQLQDFSAEMGCEDVSSYIHLNGGGIVNFCAVTESNLPAVTFGTNLRNDIRLELASEEAGHGLDSWIRDTNPSISQLYIRLSQGGILKDKVESAKLLSFIEREIGTIDSLKKIVQEG